MTYAATSLSLDSRPSIRSAKDLANFSTPSFSSTATTSSYLTPAASNASRMRLASSTSSQQRVAADLAVVVDGLDELARHRVDRVGPDELLDVDRVLVIRVLDAGRRPQAALLGRALGLQRLPLRRGEDLLVVAVGELGVGDRELALELVVAADRVEALVGLGVHARDEEGGDGRELAARVAAAVDEALDAADVGLHDLAVALEREDQRDVDRDAGGDRVLDRLQALDRGRDLDEEVGAVDELVQADRLGLGLLGVVREVRVDLERDPAVLAVALVPDGAQDVAGVADVVLGELPEDLLGIVVGGAQLTDLVVVRVALGDRALEDRRVGRHAHDALLDEALEIAVLARSAATGSRSRRSGRGRRAASGGSYRGPFGGGPHTMTLPESRPRANRG